MAPTSGWLDREFALALARAVKFMAAPRLPIKAVHVQGMGTGGRIKITVFLKSLGSKDIPEPETFIFTTEDLP